MWSPVNISNMKTLSTTCIPLLLLYVCGSPLELSPAVTIFTSMCHFGRFPEFASEGFLDAYRGHVTRGGQGNRSHQRLGKAIPFNGDGDGGGSQLSTAKWGCPHYQKRDKDVQVYVTNADASNINDAVSSKNLRGCPGCGVVFLIYQRWTNNIICLMLSL